MEESLVSDRLLLKQLRRKDKQLRKLEKKLHGKGDYEMSKRTRPSSGMDDFNALTEAQGHYILSMSQNTITIANGPAGTGKTFVAVRYALEEYYASNFEDIVCVRPSIAIEDIGFLPGSVDEKYEPYFAPFTQACTEIIGKSHLSGMMSTGRVRLQPLATLGGMSFKNSFVILEEAQNMTKDQMKMFLCRIGSGCKMVISGDEDQSFVEDNGLSDVSERLRDMQSIGIVQFDEEDSVRHPLIKDILKRYRR